MANGFRRSLARRGGRTVAALLAITLAGHGGWNAPAPSAPSAGVAARSASEIDVRPLARPASGRPALSSADPALVTADLASYDTAPGAADGAGGPVPADDAPSADAAGLLPSIQFEEAEKHANDKIDFTPGGRVTVGFTPRQGDTWKVGGRAPTALPGGRLDGKAMRRQGGPADPSASGPTDRTPGGPTAPADAAPDATVDTPTEDGAAIPATSASTVSESSTATPDALAPVTQNGLRREIFGFLPYWQLNSSTLRLDWAKISTIAYFGVGADGSGNLQKRNADGSTTVGWAGWTSSRMTSLISDAHANRTRVVLTVQSFAWNSTGTARQKALLGSSTARLNLARQIAAAVRDRGADGVNLDFEPLASGYETEFTALVKTIRAELNKVQSGYQLTFDTTGYIGNYPIEAATAPGAADAIFIMGYDYRTAGSSPVGSLAPMSRTGYDIRDTVAAYTARVAPSKLILGVPYYGRAWSTSSDALNAANTSGTKYGASTTVIYSTAADYLAQYGRKYDSTEKVAWTAYRRENCTTTYGCVTSWRQLYVDDATALGAKYDLVNTYGLRGAGIWALGYDGTRTELWATIQRKFVTDTTPPVAGIRTLASRQANPGFVVTWTGRDDVAVASYDVQVATDGGTWTSWLNATKATSATWPGADGRGYAFRVRARDLKGNLGAWNVTAPTVATAELAAGGFGLVRIDGLSIRSTADASGTKIGTYDRGDLVAVVGGPRSADGLTWWQVRGPLTEWGAVASLPAAAWVAEASSTQTYLAPTKAPYWTRVSAAIGGLGYRGEGAASIGTSSAATAQRAFSPNADGAADTIAIDWTNDRTFDAMALKIFKADGTAAGSVPLTQLGAGAQRFAWDGRVAGALLPNGRYLATIVATSGSTTFYNPTVAFRAAALASHGLTIDTVAPVVTAASAGGSLFSPNGDGTLDTVKVTLSASGANGWLFSAAPVSGSTVGAAVATTSGSGGSAAVTWNGQTTGGTVAPDGTYRLTLIAYDNAGNRVSRSWTVRLDTTPATVTAAATPGLLSPNGDGAADSTRLTWSATEKITGTARIYHGTTLIRSWTVTSAASGAMTWTGTNAAGSPVADGTYSFRVTGRDAAGNATIRSATVIVDRTLSLVRWSRSSFFPQDGDGIAPSARATFSLKRSAVVSVGIYSGATLVRTVWTNRSLAAGSHGWTWNGKDASGTFVPRGTYQVRVTATSSLGTAVINRSVVVDAFVVRLSATSAAAGQTVTLTLTTVESLKASPTVSFTQPGRTAVTRTATALGSGRYRVSFTVATGAAGTGLFRIAGRDTAGGLNGTSRTLTIR